MSRPLTAMFVALLALPLLQPRIASAQEAVTLKYDPHLEVGAKYDIELEISTDQTLTISGMPIDTHVQNFLTMSETVTGKRPGGGWAFDGEFKQVQSDMELPGGVKLSFNSNNPDQSQEGAGQFEMIIDALKATATAKWVAETDADHQLTKMEYIDDPFANVNELLKGDTDPESIKKRRKFELKRYPAEPVKPGDSWSHIEEMDLGGGQTISLEKKYTYEGPEQRDGRTFDKVKAEAIDVTYEMAPDSPSPIKISDSELKVASTEGTYWYDRQAKMYSDVQDKVQITGSLTMDAGGQKLPGELDLTLDVAAKTKIVTP